MINNKIIKRILNENNSLCKIGIFKNFTILNNNIISYKYIENFETNNKATNLCDVYILDKHPLELIPFFNNCNIAPILVNYVTKEFNEDDFDTLNGIIDKKYFLQTNTHSIIKQSNLYPPSNNEVLYNKSILVIRDFNLNSLQKPFFISQISLKVEKENYDIMEYIEVNNNSQKKKYISTIESYLLLKKEIELIFQTAILNSKNNKTVLILTDHACNYLNTNLIDEIIEIYNLFIIKYGSYFSKIIIAITPLDEKNEINKERVEMFNKFKNKIILPQNLFDIDNKDDINNEYDNTLTNLILLNK